jgi:glycosyltransferase involved in cell wall biosynthesis
MTNRARRLAAFARALPRLALPRVPRAAGTPPRVRFVHLDLGASTRYRVHHHAEQAVLAGISAETVALDDLPRLFDLRACDLLYLHRAPLTAVTLALLLAARACGIPLVCDADDLVWDERDRAYSFLDRHHDPATVARLLKLARHTRMLMRRADALVLSTPTLAELARNDLGRPTFVHPNALSQEQVERSQVAALAARRDPSLTVIGYFAGFFHVHDEDLASVAGAIRAVLEQRPAARLRIYGHLTLSEALAEPALAGRVEQRAPVDWRELPHHLAAVDISIAPLVDNPQRRAKSAIKYLEAAAIGVPTLAADLPPYQRDVRHGETGLLAWGETAWKAELLRLVDDPGLRQRLGDTARARVLAGDTTAARAAAFAALIGEVL